MKRFNKYLFIPSLAFVSIANTGCIDNNYDLNDIDMTLSSNVNITLPLSSTGEILLKNIIDLEEDGVVKLIENNGQNIYVVRQVGDTDIDPLNIDEIKINKPNLTSFDANIDLRDDTQNSSRKKVSINIGGSNIPVDNLSYHYDIKNGEAVQEIKNAEAIDITTDVVDIQSVKANETKMTLKISITGFPKHIKIVHLDNMTLQYPKGLQLSSILIKHSDTDPGVKALNIDNENSIAYLTGSDNSSNFSSNGLIMEITTNGAKAAENFVFDKESRKVGINGKFEVLGTFRIEGTEMDQAELNTAVNNAIKNWTATELGEFLADPDLRKINGIIPEWIHINGTSSFNKDLIITHVSGQFQHEIGEIKPIALNDLPDFFNDEEVVLDLDNPMLFVNTSSELPFSAKTKLTLASRKWNSSEEKDEVIATRKTHEVEIPIGKTTFWMANNKSDMSLIPEGYKANNLQYTTLYDENDSEADVTGLIRTIPDSIDVDIETLKLEGTDIDITKSYNTDLDYEIYAPLSFGEDFKLVYKDTEEDLKLGTDLDDIDFGNDTKIVITADAISTLPTNCSITLIPRDKHGIQLTTLKSISVEANGKTTTPITLSLEPTEGHTLNEALHSGEHQLDQLQYKAVLNKGVNGEVLNDSGYIKIVNIKAHVQGKVSYDAN